MRLLIIEDEPDLARTVRQALEEEGFACDVAHDGESGLFSAEGGEYDGVVLDLMLPRMDGKTVLRKLREKRATPVLVLTARDGTTDKVSALNAGADDYLTKPFDLEELVARVRALIRRAAQAPRPVLEIGPIKVQTVSRTVTRGGKPVALSPKEYALVEYLALHRGEVVSRTTLYDHLYADDGDTLSNVMDVYVSNIRKKLGAGFVKTRRGEGYIVDG